MIRRFLQALLLLGCVVYGYFALNYVRAAADYAAVSNGRGLLYKGENLPLEALEGFIELNRNCLEVDAARYVRGLSFLYFHVARKHGLASEAGRRALEEGKQVALRATELNPLDSREWFFRAIYLSLTREPADRVLQALDRSEGLLPYSSGLFVARLKLYLLYYDQLDETRQRMLATRVIHVWENRSWHIRAALRKGTLTAGQVRRLIAAYGPSAVAEVEEFDARLKKHLQWQERQARKAAAGYP